MLPRIGGCPVTELSSQVWAKYNMLPRIWGCPVTELSRGVMTGGVSQARYAAQDFGVSGYRAVTWSNDRCVCVDRCKNLHLVHTTIYLEAWAGRSKFSSLRFLAAGSGRVNQLKNRNSPRAYKRVFIPNKVIHEASTVDVCSLNYRIVIQGGQKSRKSRTSAFRFLEFHFSKILNLDNRFSKCFTFELL